MTSEGDQQEMARFYATVAVVGSCRDVGGGPQMTRSAADTVSAVTDQEMIGVERSCRCRRCGEEGMPRLSVVRAPVTK